MATNQITSPDPAMPICETCGKPMRLIDVRRKAAALGYTIPGNDEQYVIQCCGYTLQICCEEAYTKAIRLLKEYHGLT